MHVGKYLIFIVGLAAGIASMFAFSYYHNNGGNNDGTDTEVPSVEPVASSSPAESPFAVVEEASDAEEAMLTVSTSDTEALLERITNAENRIEALEEELAEARLQEFLPEENLTEEEQTEILTAIFDPTTVTEIQALRDENQLQRLELRDRAIREGWINTDRFREESRALRNASQLRDALGDEGYDKLLAAEGRNNRVQIESIIENSAADISGLQVGDIIIRYADERIFQFSDLRDGTTDGQRNESVTIQVNRNGELIDLVIPRGPMGVTLTGVSEPPQP